MQIAALFGSAFVVGLTGAMMPGPLLSATIAESARQGWTTGPKMILGHGILELLLVLAVMGGFAAFLSTPAVTSIIALLGGLFLVYLGYSICRDAFSGKIELHMNEPSKQERGLNPIWAGVFISVSNPGWSLWWATIGLTYLTIAIQFGWLGLAAFFTGHIAADLAWYTLISSVVAGGRKFLNQRVFNGILAVCGIFLLAMAGYFMYSGINTLSSIV